MAEGNSGVIRVLAVDDHPAVREGIGLLVGSEPGMKLVAEAANGREAVERFRPAPSRRNAAGCGWDERHRGDSFQNGVVDGLKLVGKTISRGKLKRRSTGKTHTRYPGRMPESRASGVEGRKKRIGWSRRCFPGEFTFRELNAPELLRSAPD